MKPPHPPSPFAGKLVDPCGSKFTGFTEKDFLVKKLCPPKVIAPTFINGLVQDLPEVKSGSPKSGPLSANPGPGPNQDFVPFRDILLGGALGPCWARLKVSASNSNPSSRKVDFRASERGRHRATQQRFTIPRAFWAFLQQLDMKPPPPTKPFCRQTKSTLAVPISPDLLK